MSKVIGKITHYFDKIGVAAMKPTAAIKVGDTIKISGHGDEVTQTISSMQVEHQAVQSAKAGDDVAIKVDSPVKEGMEVEKV